MTQPAIRELVEMRTHVCLPGDPVLALSSSALVSVGTGLRVLPSAQKQNRGDAGVATEEPQVLLAEYCAAVQKQNHPQHKHVAQYTVESPAARRYRYSAGDPIVAIVVKKVSSHFYYCYTGGPSLAVLDALSFDGATKSSRPRLVEGDVVYCYVKKANAANYVNATVSSATSKSGSDATATEAAEMELSCTAAEVGLPPKDWTSGEAVFGPLGGGTVLSLPIPYARSLLTPTPVSSSSSSSDGGRKRPRGGEADERGVAPCKEEMDDLNKTESVPASYLLSALGARVPFEVCVGINGLAWVKGQPSRVDATAGVRRTVAVAACVREAQFDVSRSEMDARIEGYFPSSG